MYTHTYFFFHGENFKYTHKQFKEIKITVNRKVKFHDGYVGFKNKEK